MEYRMIYPEKRWVTDKELLDGAADAIVNHGLTPEDGDFTIPPGTPDDAYEILHDLGLGTLTDEERSND